MTNRLYLVRHGENTANLTKEFSCRHIDYSLTEKGRLQASQTADYFLDKDIHAVYASPLKRALETAEIIAARLGLRSVVMEEFRELNVGELELRPVSAENWQLHNEICMDWMVGGRTRAFPGGDDYGSLWRRMQAGVRAVTAGQSGRNIVIAGHGGQFTMTILDLCPAATLDQILAVESQNCSITEVVLGEDLRGELVRWAAHDHLHGEAADLVSGFPKTAPGPAGKHAFK